MWASRSAGGARLDGGHDGLRLSGTVRFCSGTHLLDRALVVAGAGDGTRVVDLDLRAPQVERVTAWRAAGMAASDTHDVVLHEVPVPAEAVVGGPDAYTDRPGFAHGGAGVAAVWLGAAAAIVDHADYVGSTSGILQFAETFPGDTLIVATEPHIIHQMEKALPGKTFIGAPGADGNCNCNICPYMALNTLEKLYTALRDLTPQIEIEEGLRLQAKHSLDRMLEMASGTIGKGDLGKID